MILTVHREPPKVQIIFILKPVKDFKTNKITNLLTLVNKKKPIEGVLMLKIAKVLEKFKDMMPRKLPKKLLLLRDVDHTIELEAEAKLPA